MAGQIFVSYSRVDTEFVTRLIDDISKQGFDVWMDQQDIGAGQRWDSVIQDALENCGTFIIVLSPTSVASENVLDELSYAINEKKRIIPILLHECEIPYRIARVQFVDFTKNYQTGFRHLISEITQKVPQRPITIKKKSSQFPAVWLVGIAAAFVFCAVVGIGGYMAYPYVFPTETPTLQPSPTVTNTPTNQPTPTFTDTPTQPPVIAGVPDLVAAGIQYAPFPAKNDQTIDFQVKVTNNGTAPSGSFVVAWLSNQDIPGCSWTVSDLGAGESQNLDCQFIYNRNVTKNVTYWTTLTVDPANQIQESDEENNSRTLMLEVLP